MIDEKKSINSIKWNKTSITPKVFEFDHNFNYKKGSIFNIIIIIINSSISVSYFIFKIFIVDKRLFANVLNDINFLNRKSYKKVCDFFFCCLF